MARFLYGGSPADFTTDADGRIVPNASITVWTARTGGTQVTDLLDADGAAVTSITSGDDGSVLFSGPDGLADTLWLDSGVGARLLVRTVLITAPAETVTPAALEDGTSAGQVLIWTGTAWVRRASTQITTYDDLAGGRVINNA